MSEEKSRGIEEESTGSRCDQDVTHVGSIIAPAYSSPCLLAHLMLPLLLLGCMTNQNYNQHPYNMRIAIFAPVFCPGLLPDPKQASPVKAILQENLPTLDKVYASTR